MRDLNQTRTTNIDQEAAALLEQNRQRIRRIRRRGKPTTHFAPILKVQGDEDRQAACGQASPYVLRTVRDPYQVTCRRCLATAAVRARKGHS